MNDSIDKTRPRKSAASIASWVAVVGLASFLGLASLTAGLHSEPDQITDQVGDASPLVEIAATPANQSLVDEINDNTTMVDLRAGWIQFETADDFHIMIAVQDIPDGWGIPADAPEQNVTERQTNVLRLVANFSIAGQPYEAVAVLHSPSDGELQAGYELRSPGKDPMPLAGGFDTINDVVRLHIPKALAPAADGDKLTQFYLYSAYEDVIMDFAPDANHTVDATDPTLPGLGDLPEIGDVPEVPSTLTPNYGAEYIFGQYPHPGPDDSGGGSGGGGSAVADVSLSAERLQGDVAPGQMVTYGITVANTGGAPSEAVLSLSSAPAGWAHELSGASAPFMVAAGGSVDFQLIVSAGEEADSSLRSVVYMSADSGQADSVSILTLLASESGGDGSDGTGDGTGDGADGEGEDDGGSSPGPALLVAVAAVAVGASLARRRRA